MNHNDKRKAYEDTCRRRGISAETVAMIVDAQLTSGRPVEEHPLLTCAVELYHAAAAAAKLATDEYLGAGQ